MSVDLSGCGEWTRTCGKECVNGGGPIPNVVHFIKIDSDFHFYEWVAVMAAIKVIKPKMVFVHSTGDIKSCWWNRTRPFVQHHIVPGRQWVKTLNGRKVSYLAHQADFMKNSLLYKIGGIYSDTDSIATKSFDDLLHSYQTVVSRQYGGSPGNGLVVAQKQSCFICDFGKTACQKYDGGWSTHSIGVLANLVQKHLYKNVKVLDYNNGFFPFSWNMRDIQALFEKDMTTLPFSLHKVYAIHLFNKIVSTTRIYQHFTNYTWLSEHPSTAAHAVRAALPSWFNQTYLNMSLCIDPPQL